MRILICHGYLLKGTGSNMYVSSLARALCRQGHQVLLICQDPDPRLDFVSSFVSEDPDGTARVVWERETSYPGSCRVFKPDIGGLLPVYVMDSYPGFSVKEFTSLDTSELEWYVDRNRRSLRRQIRDFAPDVIQANHAVMLPYIIRPAAEEAGVAYYVSIHGSAIEYTVKKDTRYLACGVEGLGGAAGIFIPSEHTGRQVTEVFGDDIAGLSEKLILLPPGVDTELFTLASHDLVESVRLLNEAVAARIQGVTVGDFRGSGAAGPLRLREGPDIAERVEAINALHTDWLPEAGLAEKLEAFARDGGPFVIFLGKLLETKGIQCVIPALPLVLSEHADARLVVVGFGELRGLLELMLTALDEGDVEYLARLCRWGNESYALAPDAFAPVISFIEELQDLGGLEEYLRLCRGFDLASSVIFTGYLTPDEHHFLLPHARAALIPSLAQEAFGLVATEAMAAGVAPIACLHSGLETALEPVKLIWGPDSGKLLLGTRDRLVARIAYACDFLLGLDDATLHARGAQMRGEVKTRFSWDAVARRMTDYMSK